jgi:hypothetical protein
MNGFEKRYQKLPKKVLHKSGLNKKIAKNQRIDSP